MQHRNYKEKYDLTPVGIVIVIIIFFFFFLGVSKDMEPVHSEEDQPWDFFGRNDAKAETPVLWPPDAKS